MSTARSPAEESPDTVRPHDLLAKVFHWGFIVVFVYALTKQLDEVEELEDAALLEFEMFFASFFLALVIVRYLYMRLTRPTALPAATPRRERLLARAVHVAMYVGLGTIAATGLVIGGLYGADVKSGVAMEAVLLLHEIAVNSTYFLIALHVAAAVQHRLKGDGIWTTMVPLWKEQAPD